MSDVDWSPDAYQTTREEAGFAGARDASEVGEGAVTLPGGGGDWRPPTRTDDGRDRSPLPGVTTGRLADETTNVVGFTSGWEDENRRRGRGRRPPPNFRLEQTVDLTTGDPQLDAAARGLQDELAGIDAANLGLQADELGGIAAAQRQVADRFAEQADAQEMLMQQREVETRAMFDDLTSMNRAVMEQRVDPTRFFSNIGAGSGLASAASVALGVLGQSLAPGLENSALQIINQAVERDVAAQVADLQNRQQGVAMQRTLYRDLLATYQHEDVAREALRSMYLAEMERRIGALSAQTQSQITRNNAGRLLVAVAEERVRSAAEAARARSRIVYTETTQGRQRPGSTQGIRTAAAQMRASSPLVATGVAQAMEQHGFGEQARARMGVGRGEQAPAPRPQGPAQVLAPAAAMSSPDQAITPSDMRGRQSPQQTRVTRGGGQRQVDEARQAVEQSTGDRPVDRRQGRSLYRSARSNPAYTTAPRLSRIQTPDGPILAVRTGERRATSDSNQGADVQILRPFLDAQGRMVAVTRNGASRYVRPGDALRSGERIVGGLFTQQLRPLPAESARYIRQTGDAVRVATSMDGADWYVPASVAQQLDRQTLNNEIATIDQSRTGVRLARQLGSLLEELNNSGVDLTTAARQGASAPLILRLQGIMAQLSGLGVLQEGERQAIRDMSSLPLSSENWIQLFTDIDRARATVGTLRRGFNEALQTRRISRDLYSTPSVNDITARHR